MKKESENSKLPPWICDECGDYKFKQKDCWQCGRCEKDPKEELEE